MNPGASVHIVLGLVLSPFLFSVINRTKAFFAGRQGQPWLQPYEDVAKLLRKGAVFSRTTTWVFRAGPIVGLAATLSAMALLPFGSMPALISFPGDFILFAYLLGLMRFFTVIAALDTGSSFEGMGASREVIFSTLAELVFFLGIAGIARLSGHLSLSGIFTAISVETWIQDGPILAMILFALGIVFLTENARIPIDDPNTHLELTMIHEVMVLDHGGPDFGVILYSSALKLWLLGSVIVGVLWPGQWNNPWLDGLIALAEILGLAVLTGIIESSMARLRLIRVPQLLLGAGALVMLALILVLRQS